MPTFVVKITDKKQSRYATYEIEAENVEQAAKHAVATFSGKDVAVIFDVDIDTMTVEEVDFTRGQSLMPLARWEYSEGNLKKLEKETSNGE